MRALIAATVLALGMIADAGAGFAFQAVIGLTVWAALSWVFSQVDAEERRALMLCVVIATVGEMVLSLGWGLYTYRLENIPPYVPPGHALLLFLGLRLAERMPEPVASGVIGVAAAYSIAAFATGLDTFGVLLVLLLVGAALLVPAQRRLYASTFLLSLALELVGTALGNWSWAREVPGLGLVTTNPPAVAGAFYCALDALVAAGAVLLAARIKQVQPLGESA